MILCQIKTILVFVEPLWFLQLQTFTMIMIVVPKHKGTLWPFLLSSVSSSKAAVASSALGAFRCATILASVWGSSGFERSLCYYFVRKKAAALRALLLHQATGLNSRGLAPTSRLPGKKERPRPSQKKTEKEKMQDTQTHFPLWRYFLGTEECLRLMFKCYRSIRKPLLRWHYCLLPFFLLMCA